MAPGFACFPIRPSLWQPHTLSVILGLDPRIHTPAPPPLKTRDQTLAVYTDITEDDLSGFLKQYDVGTLTSYKGIAEGVENTNFLLHTTKGSYILTLYEKRVDQTTCRSFSA
jgi:hypothetical protein